MVSVAGRGGIGQKVKLLNAQGIPTSRSSSHILVLSTEILPKACPNSSFGSSQSQITSLSTPATLELRVWIPRGPKYDIPPEKDKPKGSCQWPVLSADP